jgi:hypothetical protein
MKLMESILSKSFLMMADFDFNSGFFVSRISGWTGRKLRKPPTDHFIKTNSDSGSMKIMESMLSGLLLIILTFVFRSGLLICCDTRTEDCVVDFREGAIDGFR